MSIRTKLAIVSVGFLIPIGLLMYFFITTRNEKIDFAQKELEGDVYLQPMRCLMQHVPNHKLLANRLASSTTALVSAKAELSAVRDSIDFALELVGKADERFGTGFTSTEKYTNLAADWQALKKKVHAPTPISAAESNELHTKLIADMRGLISLVGDKSNLILDPDLDSYYMMDLTLLKMPEQEDLIYQVTALGERIIANGKRSDDEKIQLIVLLGLLNSNIDNTANDYTVAFANNPASNLKPALEDLAHEKLARLKEFVKFTEASLTKPDSITLAAPQFLAASTKALQASYDMWDTGLTWLDVLLVDRLKATKKDQYTNLSIVAIVLLMTVVFGVLMLRTIVRSIRDLSLAAKKVSNGDLNVHVHSRSTDELGSLGMSFNAMVESLQSYFVEVQQEQQESLRLAKQAEEAAAQVVDEQKYLERNVDRMLVEMRKFAQGDLTVQLMPEREDAIATLFEHFNQATNAIGQIITQVQESTISTARALAEVEDISIVLANATRERSLQAQEIADSISEMVTTITENANSAVRTADAADRNEKAAQESAQALSEMTKKIHEVNNVISSSLGTIENLGDSGSEINKVVDVIEAIASQTNLLALNAAIEAARAGTAGRGFAVVADEVRKLADRTRQATKQIKTTVEGIHLKTQNAVEVIRRSNDEMNKGITLVEQTSEVLQQIAKYSKEMLQMTEEIVRASGKQSAEGSIASKNVMAISKTTRDSAQADAQLMHLIQQSHHHMEELLDVVKQFVVRNQSREVKKQLQSSTFSRRNTKETAEALAVLASVTQQELPPDSNRDPFLLSNTDKRSSVRPMPTRGNAPSNGESFGSFPS